MRLRWFKTVSSTFQDWNFQIFLRLNFQNFMMGLNPSTSFFLVILLIKFCFIYKKKKKHFHYWLGRFVIPWLKQKKKKSGYYDPSKSKSWKCWKLLVLSHLKIKLSLSPSVDVIPRMHQPRSQSLTGRKEALAWERSCACEERTLVPRAEDIKSTTSRWTFRFKRVTSD